MSQVSSLCKNVWTCLCFTCITKVLIIILLLSHIFPKRTQFSFSRDFLKFAVKKNKRQGNSLVFRPGTLKLKSYSSVFHLQCPLLAFWPLSCWTMSALGKPYIYPKTVPDKTSAPHLSFNLHFYLCSPDDFATSNIPLLSSLNISVN